jgi:hypothetical protein
LPKRRSVFKKPAADYRRRKNFYGQFKVKLLKSEVKDELQAHIYEVQNSDEGISS